MIRKIVFLLGLLIPFALCSCNNTKNINSFIYYKVADECEGMGKIYGEERQNPLVGDYTAEVTAIPNEGYVFVKWNDESVEPTRKDVSTNESFVTFIAYFEAAND